MSEAPEKTPLFEARKGGYHNYRIPGIVVTPGGVVLAYCEARRDSGGDHDVIDILMRRSTDGGATWSEPVCVADHEDYAEPTMNNFVCIADAVEGCVHALFCNRYHRAYCMRSDDDGRTWSKPAEITQTFETFRGEYDWTICAVGPGHGIQHSSGRLIAPIWLSLGTNFHLPNRAGVIYSDDRGRSWKAGDMIPEVFPNCNETTAVELRDGSVMFNMRMHSERHRRLVAISPDGSGNWRRPAVAEELVDPICHAGICRYDADTILFSNPDSLTKELAGRWDPVCDRRNLTVRASYDEGATWPVKRAIEPGPSGYSDLCVLSDHTIVCFYEDGMMERMADTARLTVARFTLKWIEGEA